MGSTALLTIYYSPQDIIMDVAVGYQYILEVNMGDNLIARTDLPASRRSAPCTTPANRAPRQSPGPSYRATLTHRPADAEAPLPVSHRPSRPTRSRRQEARAQTPTLNSLDGTGGRARHNRVRCYDRDRDLPRLIAIWPAELGVRDLCGQSAIIRRLHNALRAERRRALAGHWTYDMARHCQLLAAYRAEVVALEQLQASASVRSGSDGNEG